MKILHEQKSLTMDMIRDERKKDIDELGLKIILIDGKTLARKGLVIPGGMVQYAFSDEKKDKEISSYY